ncbi:hypothetical protein HKD37_13G038052 [Glycine soja]|nr:hypothetical protein JHK87_037576 [Glycine soja]KAG4978348.1 hypothetical protein JHK86_037822 [Glycine max]KAH1103966.1 hypothetical protein GYH30_037737 [Glycine max]
MVGTFTLRHGESNKENIPPGCTKLETKKNPIPLMAQQSFKRKMKRLPLADITNLVNNSAQELNQLHGFGVSALSSASFLLHSISRRRTTPVLLRGSKSLRLGFR